MQERFPNIPSSIAYPAEYICKKWGRYFTNSISWEIITAIEEGFEEIFIFGVDMAQDDEYCISKLSKVLTSELNWIQAGDIKKGQKLIGFDETRPNRGSKRQYQETIVEDTQTLKRPCYNIFLEDGSQLMSSAEHRWLTYMRGGMDWRRTDHLKKSDKMVKPLDVWETGVSRGAAYLAGAFDSDGFLSQIDHGTERIMTIGYNQKPNAMSAAVEKLLKEHSFKFGMFPHGTTTNYTIQGGRKELIRFMGEMQPPRLMEQFNPNLLGSMKGYPIAIKNIDFIGEQEVIALKTSTGTFIAEGFASHNSQQRPSCEYFIGIARGMGIKVHVPDKSDLLKTLWLYPFEPESPMWVKCESRRRELQQRANEIYANEMAMRDNRNQVIGAIENMNYVQKAWGNTRRDAGLIKG